MRGTSALVERFGTSAEHAADQELAAAEAEGTDIATASAMLPKLGSFEVMNRTIDVMQAALARHRLAEYPPDIMFEVPRTASRSMDFHRATDIIDTGRELAAKALDSYAEDNAGGRSADTGA